VSADDGRRAARIRRRDRHGRGLRGTLAPQDVPLYRSRAERFDDLVLQAVAQLEPRWENELSRVEFAVEEIPATDPQNDDPDTVPLARLDAGPGPGGPGAGAPAAGAPAAGAPAAGGPGAEGAEQNPPGPARIVLYRRPLMARADDEEELAEVVLDVVVEEFARLLGIDPQAVDPDYPED
jgi:predicted Zn-dependent protease with MMP-like domain